MRDSMIRNLISSRAVQLSDGLPLHSLKFEIAIPIVTREQSVTGTTLQTANGQHIWKPANWEQTMIEKIEVELEYEVLGTSGDIDLYNITTASKIQDLVTATASVAKTIQRFDVTTAMKAITTDSTIGIQLAGDGTNATYVYTAKLIIHYDFSLG